MSFESCGPRFRGYRRTTGECHASPPATAVDIAVLTCLSLHRSVKQLFKEGCCAINFNLFTLDAGATNPNCIGIQRAAASKGVAGKPSLSLDESYAKRRAAKEAKEAKKRRASAARAAKRKRSSSGSSKRRSRRGATASSDDPSGGVAGAADGGEPATRRTSKKRSYSSKARFSRRK